MANVGGRIDGGGDLTHVKSKDPFAGRVFDAVIAGINRLAENLTSSATGESKAPHAPQAATITRASSGETAQITINHAGQIQRGIRYFTEIYSDDPATSGTPVAVIDHGSSRTHTTILPTYRNPGTGNIAINYSGVTYAQYRNSQPSEMTQIRTPSGSTTWTMNGASVHNMMAGTGSGTGSNSGQQKGWGLGKIQTRNS